MPNNHVGSEFKKPVIQLIKQEDNNHDKKSPLHTHDCVTCHDFFLTDSNMFAPYRTQNNIKFLYTGEDYFGEVAKAIDDAKKTIYITGWQINYDVLLKTPEAKSKKKEREDLEKELAATEELIKKLYALSKPQIEIIIQQLKDLKDVDIVPVIDKILKAIEDKVNGEEFQLDLQRERTAVLDYLNAQAHAIESQMCLIDDPPLKIRGIQLDGFNLDTFNLDGLKQEAGRLSEKSIEVCYNDGTCDRFEIQKLIGEVYNALKIEDKIRQIAEEANSGLKDSLWEYLRKAVLRGVKVYVMPWSCPPVGPVNTFDLDTMLAIFQLNAGLAEQRAFFTFSTLDSDMGKLAGLFYSHHQKSVIIDHKIGFVGGMDLAYGRRDDKSFNLDASVRFGNDRYNPCIPHMQQALRSTHVSRMALTVSTLLEISNQANFVNQVSIIPDLKTALDNWWNTPFSWGVAYDIRKELQPLHDAYKEMIDEKIEQVLSQKVDPILSYYFTNSIDQLVYFLNIVDLVDSAVNQYSAFSMYYPIKLSYPTGYREFLPFPYKFIEIDNESVDNLKRHYYEGEKYVALNNIARAIRMNKPIRMAYYNEAKVEIYKLLTETKVGQLYNEILGLDFFNQTFNATEDTESNLSAMSLLWHTFFLFQDRAIKLKEPYYYLDKKLQPLMPSGGVTLNDVSQPRMPWHDVSVKISGPSVYDLSLNFISRWNTSQAQIESQIKPIDTKLLLSVVYWAKGIIEQANNTAAQNGFNVKAIIPDNIKTELENLGKELIESKANIVWLDPNIVPKPDEIEADPDGDEAQVQIIRSAPCRMLNADIKAMKKVMDKFNHSPLKQPNAAPLLNVDDMIEKTVNSFNEALKATCQRDSQNAWITAIKGSQYFLYIESQFFQSAYGIDEGYRKKDETGKAVFSGPQQALSAVPPELKEYNVDRAIEELNVKKVNWEKLRALADREPRKFLSVMGKISKLMIQVAQKRMLNELFKNKDTGEEDPKERNALIDAIATRIDLAIREESPYHVYLVIPVHPEGQLNDATVMHTVHLAMQTLVNGEKSLIKSIQRSLCIHKLMKDGKSYAEAKEAAETPQANRAPLFTQFTNWTDYLTLLNLRTWDKFTGRGMTEQIYVHSKILIADDRIAIIGSANANDRSMEGDRDSELGAIIKGNEPAQTELFGDGKLYTVSKAVHEFRKGLWSKLFAVEAKSVPIDPAFTGGELTNILNQPVNKATWQAIQQIANKNANEYNKVFNFIPQNDSPAQEPKQPNLGPYQIPDQDYYPLGCSIWPAWSYKDPDRHENGGEITAPLPFEDSFWAGNQIVQYGEPENIRGFIVALPIKWTQGENNTSSFHHYIVS